jgi:pimeloyl-ACP methyl ester carboxylesterase
MFRNLMPLLADRYRVIAADYPAFGHSAAPSRDSFRYTHEHFSEVIEALLDRLSVNQYAIYLMDFGGPIGYRLMLKKPDKVPDVIVQNTPVFGEPTDGEYWIPLLAYWKDESASGRSGARKIISPESIRDQYIVGTKDPTLIGPDNCTLDSRPGIDEIMLDLLYDIRNNRETVSNARKFFGQHQDRVMIVTGANDALFP